MGGSHHEKVGQEKVVIDVDLNRKSEAKGADGNH